LRATKRSIGGKGACLKARVATRAGWLERRGVERDGERALMPAFGGYAGGLSI